MKYILTIANMLNNTEMQCAKIIKHKGIKYLPFFVPFSNNPLHFTLAKSRYYVKRAKQYKNYYSYEGKSLNSLRIKVVK